MVLREKMVAAERRQSGGGRDELCTLFHVWSPLLGDMAKGYGCPHACACAPRMMNTGKWKKKDFIEIPILLCSSASKLEQDNSKKKKVKTCKSHLHRKDS